MVKVIAIPAFKDNYIWLLVNPDSRYCAIVDPGDAAPVIDFLNSQKFIPCAILITHHHFDHTGGIEKLHAAYPDMPIYGPTNDKVEHIDHKLVEGDVVKIPELALEFKVYDIPGHTKGHIAYFGAGMLFCGDTLFAAGCGRLFEGTAAQMFASLSKLASLPDDTLVYCAHEYTAANLRFAETIEPQNKDIQIRIQAVNTLREQNKITLPSSMQLEKLTNPFLRCEIKTVVDSVRSRVTEPLADPVSIFQALRAWKDTF